MPDHPGHEPWKPDPLSQLLVLAESQQNQINELRDSSVTKKEFDPVKMIAYGLVTVIVLSVITAIVGLVLASGRGRIGP